MINNDSLSILKLFTRKLANCRYKVAPKALVEYMKGGRFGYTCEEGEEIVVTNEYVFASDVTAVVAHIRNIFKEPHIFLRKDEVIQNTAVASKMDNVSLSETYKDEKIWRVKNGAVAPEFVHAYVYEDNLAIYENRFICYLIDELYEIVSKKIRELVLKLRTLNGLMGGVECFTAEEYVAFADEKGGIPVLANDKDATAGAIGELIKAKKTLVALKSRELYLACKKAGVFNIKNLHITNILEGDPDYNYCYNFYINYLNKEPIFTTESKMYLGFVTVNLFKVLTDLGFAVSEENENVGISNSAHLKFEKVVFEKAPFTVTFSKEGEDGVMMTVKVVPDGNEGKYLFRAVNGARAKMIPEFSDTSSYAKSIAKATEGVLRTFLVNDIECVDDYNALYVVPNRCDAQEVIKFALKSCLYVIEGLEFIHTRYCPICGSSLVAPDYGDYTCSDCGTTYHVFKYAGKEYIWVKSLPPVNGQKRAKTEEKITFEEEVEVVAPVEEKVEEPVAETKETVEEVAPVVETVVQEVTAVEDDASAFPNIGIKKSFIAKLSQGSEENQAFYSELKNYLLSFKRVNSRVSWNYDSFNQGRDVRVKIAVRGKTLVAFFALNPAEFENTKYYPHDMGDVKKFADTPMMIKVKSERSVKYAKELIDLVLENAEKKSVYEDEVFSVPYMTDEELIKEGQAKLVERNI